MKDSYRLLTKKDPVTDAAYEVLTDQLLPAVASLGWRTLRACRVFNYRGCPRFRLHSPRAERMRENIAVTPSA